MTSPPDREALRREMKARRKALKRQLADQKAAIKSRLAAQKAAIPSAVASEQARLKAKRRRRRRITLLIILIIIWLLLRDCDCECGEPGPPPPPPDAAVVTDAAPPDAAVPKPPPKKRTRKRFKGRIKPKARPDFVTPTPPPQDWLAALRLQVAARSPRLARCFEGSEQPGALKWSASVDVPRGVVSDHDFEPVLDGAEMTRSLERCLIGVLSTPSYRLPAPKVEGPTSPERVSIVLEF